MTAHLNELGRSQHPSAITVLTEKVCGELGAAITEIIKLQQPERQSGLDGIATVLAIGKPGFELWQALQDHDRTLALLSGAQLGANVVELAASTTEAMASMEPTIHGLCILITAATGVAKICIELKSDEDTGSRRAAVRDEA